MENVKKLKVKDKEYNLDRKQPEIGMFFVNKRGDLIAYAWPQKNDSSKVDTYIDTINESDLKRYKGKIENDYILTNSKGNLEVVVANASEGSNVIRNIKRIVNRSSSLTKRVKLICSK